MTQGTVFTYSGLTSSALGIYVSDVQRDPLPPIRERTVTLPTRDGVWDFGPYYDPRHIDLTCWIVTDTRADLLAALDVLAGVLDPKQYRNNTPPFTSPLVLSDQPRVSWNCRLSGSQAVKMLATYAEFKLNFLATDPFPHTI